MLFDEYAQLYLEFKEHELKASTFDKYSKIVQHRLLGSFGGKDIEALRPSDVKRWLYNIDDVGPKSKRHYLGVLSGIFQEALYDEVIQRNPVSLVRLPKNKKPDIYPFTPDQVLQIFDYSTRSKYEHFTKISFLTGMRPGEIHALRKSDIHFKDGYISVSKSLNRFGETSPKTIGSIRNVPILDSLLPTLDKLVATGDSDYLLVTRYGEPYRDSNSFVNFFWRQMLEALSIDYRRPYTARHTFATNMLYQNLVTPPELAQILGHSSTQMVYDVYVSFLDQSLANFDRTVTPYICKGI